MKIKFSKLKIPNTGVIVFPISSNLELSEELKAIDERNNDAISKAAKRSDYKAKKGKSFSITGNIDDFDRIVLIGTGDEGDDDKGVSSKIDLQLIGSKLYLHLNAQRIKKAKIVIEDTLGGFSTDFVAAQIAYGAKLRSYNFDKYFTTKEDDEKPSVESLEFMLESSSEADSKYKRLDAIVEGVFLARNLVSEPGNVLNPESYAEICKDLKAHGVKVEILGEKEMKKLGMDALLSVGEGSRKESQLVVMQWQGIKISTEKPIAFIGKGVTFDTGGVSIKPSTGLHEMKFDMAGSAAVVGLMKTLALRKARANVVGVIGLVENMADGQATRPGDVVKTMSGQTVEIQNTDAEGRLVLADALWYTQQRFKPDLMVNLATLTGAMIISLGVERAGMFCNDDELAEKLFEAGEAVNEKLWRLPLDEGYDDQIKSKIADWNNLPDGKGAGSIAAAKFLEKFTNDVPWAHLDIAGTAWGWKAKDCVPEGGTGFGVRLLDRLVADNYEG